MVSTDETVSERAYTGPLVCLACDGTSDDDASACRCETPDWQPVDDLMARFVGRVDELRGKHGDALAEVSRLRAVLGDARQQVADGLHSAEVMRRTAGKPSAGIKYAGEVEALTDALTILDRAIREAGEGTP